MKALRITAKRHLIAFGRDGDSFCARLSAGLMAVAMLLGFLVVTLCVIHAQDYFPGPYPAASGDFAVSAGHDFPRPIEPPTRR